jgi:hypothetical protein
MDIEEINKDKNEIIRVPQFEMKIGNFKAFYIFANEENGRKFFINTNFYKIKNDDENKEYFIKILKEHINNMFNNSLNIVSSQKHKFFEIIKSSISPGDNYEFMDYGCCKTTETKKEIFFDFFTNFFNKNKCSKRDIVYGYMILLKLEKNFANTFFVESLNDLYLYSLVEGIYQILNYLINILSDNYFFTDFIISDSLNFKEKVILMIFNSFNRFKMLIKEKNTLCRHYALSPNKYPYINYLLDSMGLLYGQDYNINQMTYALHCCLNLLESKYGVNFFNDDVNIENVKNEFIEFNLGFLIQLMNHILNIIIINLD